MNDPDLYVKSNPFQVRDALFVLKNYKDNLRNASENDVILDIGCGTGDVTTRILAPACNQYELLVGIDLSKDMINYAQQNCKDDNIHYEVLDIAGDITDFKEDWVGFTKIFSFYCLHWIKNQKAALRNIKSLMLKNAECLLVFVAQCPVFEMYERVAKNPKWASYMEDVNNFVPDTQHTKQPAFRFTQMMEEVGLRNANCDLFHKSFAFTSTTMLRDSVVAVNPFIKRIPAHEKEDYINECVRILLEMNSTDEKKNVNESYSFSYKLLVAHAIKD